MTTLERSAGSRRLPAWQRPLLVIALLCAVSLAVLKAPQRYLALPQEAALVALSDLAAWQRAPSGASMLVTQPGTLRLQARGERLVWAYRPLWPLEASSTVRVSAELRGEDLAGGRLLGGAGQFIAQSLDRRHRRIPHWPYRVGGIDGSSDWHRVELVVPASEATAGMQLVAFVAAERGFMEVRDPRAEIVNERALFAIARHALLVTWLAAWAWCAWQLLRPGHQRLPRALLACATTLALVAALAPPAQLNQFAKRVLIDSQDVVHELVALWPDGEAPPASAPAGDADAGETRKQQTAPAVAGNDTPGDTAAGNARARRDNARREAVKLDTAPIQRSYWMPPDKDLDKRSHLAGFALLALLAAVAFRRQPAWQVLPAMAMLAVSMETLQGFTTMREPDVLDLRADLLGAVIGVVGAWLSGRAWRLMAAARRLR